MIDIRTGKPITRRDALAGGIAAIIASGCAPSLVGSANATVWGMMRNVGARNAVMFGLKRPFRKVEYIANVGRTQFIDTLVSINNYELLDIEFQRNAGSLGINIFGCRDSGAVRLLLQRWPNFEFKCAGSSISTIPNTSDRIRIISTPGIVEWYVNGQLSQSTQLLRTVSVQNSFYLFSIHNGEGSTNEEIKIYRATLLPYFDMIPVVADFGDGDEGCMFDEIHPDGGPFGNGLYRNSGTGAFAWG